MLKNREIKSKSEISGFSFTKEGLNCRTDTQRCEQGRTVLSHDYVFWCGDFNYRVSLEREQAVQAAVDQVV